MACEQEGRDPGEVPTNQGTLETDSDPQELGEAQNSLPHNFSGNQPAHTLILNSSPPELGDGRFLLSSLQVCGTLLPALLAN